MGASLTSREDSIINTLLEVRGVRVVLLEEDETSARTTESLMSGSGNDVTVLERAVQLPCSNQARSVSDVGHEKGAFLVRNFAEFCVVPVAGVSRCTTYDEAGFEDLGLASKTRIINEIGVWGDDIGKGLEIDG